MAVIFLIELGPYYCRLDIVPDLRLSAELAKRWRQRALDMGFRLACHLDAYAHETKVAEQAVVVRTFIVQGQLWR
jgi:hypothetical protein